ncbi:MAG: EAL domain-containing protein [Labilithrix sp.]|nr:EAL domain-containing protein [Labilithrix sp.]MBX3219174.1 EAL domain-containing protein [Labilithrix sp.]
MRETREVGPKAARDALDVRRPRLLLVEDDGELRRGLARALGTEFEVTAISNGANAAELLVRTDYDAVLSDIALPGMSGIDLLRLVRAYDLDVPVVLITAQPSAETMREALELGALTHLHKPVANDVLEATLRHAVKLSRMARLRREAIAAGAGASLTGEREELSATFERALDTLTIHFQPIVDRRTQRTAGFEALMRPKEPDVPHPGAMLQLAERVGRLDEMGRRVREIAAETFHPADDDTLLFVNLHPSELHDPALFDAASPLGRISKHVVLEVTERSALNDVATTRQRVSELRALGFRIAVDDLGAGYAGLTCFAILEPEIVKLDMSLIRDIETSPVRSHIVDRITRLCHELDMLVVAEGIETVPELGRVITLGCDYLQGYLLGKPGPALVPSSHTW